MTLKKKTNDIKAGQKTRRLAPTSQVLVLVKLVYAAWKPSRRLDAATCGLPF